MNHLNKIWKRLLVIAAVGMLVIPFFDRGELQAANVNVSAWNNGNGTFSIAVSSSLTGAVTVTTSNGATSLFWCEGGSCSVQSGSTTISGTGTITVTATPKNPMDDGEGHPVTATGSATSVTVTKPAPQPDNKPSGNTNSNPSGNTTPNTTPSNGSGNQSDDDEKNQPTKDATSILASLSIDKGELSPKFSPTETSYKVNLPAGTTALNVSAKAKNSKAKVEGSGNIKLTVGDNTIAIRCIAEDGTATTYTIKAHVSEKPVTYVPYKNTKLGVLNEAAPVPKLFTETKIKVHDKEVIAWKNQALKLTLLYMQNEKENTKELYIYDTVKEQAISIYKPFTYQGKNLIMIDVPEKLQKREGMTFTTISLGDYTLPGWKFNDSKFKNYALLYVMDEKGNTLYYQYEKTEDSLQIFSQAAAIQQADYQKYVEEMEQKSNLYLMIMLGLGIFGILLLIILIIVIIKGKSRVKYKKVPVQNTMLGAEAKSLLRDDDE